MADAKQHGKTLAVLVPYSTVYWFPELNAARGSGDYGKTDALFNSFVEQGWCHTGDGTVDVEEMTPAQNERAVKERTEWWNGLKAAAANDASRIIELTVFEEMFVEMGKGGKKTLKPITYTGVSGNRRNSVYFKSCVERRRQNLEIVFEIPVQVKHYASALDRLIDQVHENEGKTEGFMGMSMVDCLLAAVRMVELGAIQNRVRDAFKAGTGQKLWGIVILDKRFPNLRIVERMKRKPEDDGYIPLQKVKFKDMPDLVLRSDPKALAAKNQSQVTKGLEAIKPLTEAQVGEYFANVGKSTTEAGNEQKVMKGDAIRNLAERFPTRIVKAAFDAVVKNNTDGLVRYQTGELGLNAADELLQNGSWPEVEAILVGLVSLPTTKRADVLKAMLATLPAKTNISASGS